MDCPDASITHLPSSATDTDDAGVTPDDSYDHTSSVAETSFALPLDRPTTAFPDAGLALIASTPPLTVLLIAMLPLAVSIRSIVDDPPHGLVSEYNWLESSSYARFPMHDDTGPCVFGTREVITILSEVGVESDTFIDSEVV
jgi:hypothetical protein